MATMTYALLRRKALWNIGVSYGHVMPLPARVTLLRGREQYYKALT